MPSLRPAARLLVVLMLFVPASAAAQSAGDEQYVDPFGDEEPRPNPPRPQPDPDPGTSPGGGEETGAGGGGAPPSDPGGAEPNPMPNGTGAPAGGVPPGSTSAPPGAGADRLADGLRRLEGESPLPGLSTVAPSPTEAAVPAADATDASESSPTPWIVLALAAAAAIGGGLFMHRRRRLARTPSVGSPQPD